MMRIEVLCIGSELLKHKVNSNSNGIAKKIEPLGLRLHQVILLPDDKLAIVAALRQSLKRSNLIFVSGGLGPTFDDITRECWASVLKKKLIFVPEILADIEKKFVSIGRKMSPENKRQAYIIDGASAIKNALGTAPGQHIFHRNAYRNTRRNVSIFLLPGPPKELNAMMDQSVVPILKKLYGAKPFLERTWHSFGIPESEIDEKIAALLASFNRQYKDKISFTILAHLSVVDLQCSLVNIKMERARSIMKQFEQQLYALIGDVIFGKDEETLVSAVAKLLTARKETIATAESCTGGWLAKYLTDVPGSSRYFLEGIVSYSNASKIRLLKVSPKTLKKFGAVSEETAREMAIGALKKSGATWAISTTGIAGPAGGSAQKPVGTVCFAIAAKNFCKSFTQKFHGTRSEIRDKTALTALNYIRQNLL